MKFPSLLLEPCCLCPRWQSQTNNLTSGLGTNWVNLPGSDQTNQMTMPLNATNGAVFFRLVRPY